MFTLKINIKAFIPLDLHRNDKKVDHQLINSYNNINVDVEIGILIEAP